MFSSSKSDDFMKYFVLLTFLPLLLLSCRENLKQEPVTETPEINVEANDKAMEPATKTSASNIVEAELKAEQKKAEDPKDPAIKDANPTTHEIRASPKETNQKEQVGEPDLLPHDSQIPPQEELLVALTDDQTWDELLKKHVSATGQVNYQGFTNDREKLASYLKELQENPPQENWSRAQQLAYWINAYNAFTVDLIVRNYPLKSIQDLKDPWDQKFINLKGRTFSLNQIEHQIIRPVFQDPRIHFAVVCAAVSCPKLLNQAYRAATLDQQLDAQADYFLNKSGKNQLNQKEVRISKLFDWYGEDFTKQGNIVDYLNQYAKQPISRDARVQFLEYNWDLNE